MEPGNLDSTVGGNGREQKAAGKWKLDLSTRVFIILILLLVVGGSFKSSVVTMETQGVKSVVTAVNEYHDGEQEREMKKIFFTRLLDSMVIKDWDEAVRVMEQIKQ